MAEAGDAFLVGAHLSVAGGYERAVHRAVELRCTALQIFTRNNVQWRAKPLQERQCLEFRRALSDSAIGAVIAHANYLANLASPERSKRERSIRVVVDELRRCARLGVAALVLHPGSHQGEGERAGIRRVAAALRRVLRQTAALPVRLLLETTAGQGSALGYRFEQLAAILNEVAEPARTGVCIDTCHMFAAGYGLAPEAAYETTMEQLDRHVGLRQVYAVHLNDSARPRGSRVDRHAHIGRGAIGLDGFRYLVNDPHLCHLPMVIETPKRDHRGVDMDPVNLRVLRSLRRASASTT